MFAAPNRDEFYQVMGERYEAAKAEAAKVGANKDIPMRTESLKPAQLGLTAYNLPVGNTTITLKDNVGFFPAGILNRTADFDYMKWFQGAGIRFIADWFVLPIYYLSEYKQGAYVGNVKAYEFRGSETFRMYVHSLAAGTPTEVEAWLLGFVSMPDTMAETNPKTQHTQQEGQP